MQYSLTYAIIPLAHYFWTVCSCSHRSLFSVWIVLLLNVLASVNRAVCRWTRSPPLFKTRGPLHVTGNHLKWRAKSLIISPSVLNLTLITVDVDLGVCAGQTLWASWYSIRSAHFGICLSSLGHLVPIFGGVWTKLWLECGSSFTALIWPVVLRKASFVQWNVKNVEPETMLECSLWNSELWEAYLVQNSPLTFFSH